MKNLLKGRLYLLLLYDNYFTFQRNYAYNIKIVFIKKFKKNFGHTIWHVGS